MAAAMESDATGRVPVSTWEGMGPNGPGSPMSSKATESSGDTPQSRGRRSQLQGDTTTADDRVGGGLQDVTPASGLIPAVGNGMGRRKGRDGSNNDIHMAMDLTRRIKSCREWREVQALFEAEVQRYNQIHVSATVVAMRR